MHIAVIIVSFKSESDVLACLDWLGRSSHSDFEVVVCENGGLEAFERLEVALPKTLAGGQAVSAVCPGANLGYAGGVNYGVAARPACDAWWILNPDTEPHPEALAELVKRLRRGDCGAVGGTLLFPDGRVQAFGGRWTALLARAVSIGYGGEARSVAADEVERRQNYLSGASMLVSREFMAAAGPLREDYFLYCEEVEWCLRARRAGQVLGFAPEAHVVHHQGTSTGNPPDVREQSRMPVYLNERNRILLTRDLWPGLAPVAAVGALALIALRFVRRGAWRQAAYAIDGWFAGLRNERGRPQWLRV